MRGLDRRGSYACLLLSATCLGALAPSPLAAREGASSPWTRVQVQDATVTFAVRRALDGAAHRVADPRCQAVLAHPGFRDQQGRRLDQKLAATGVSFAEYLTWIVFADGRHGRACQGSAIAYTAPGARVVFVCSRQFLINWKYGSRDTEIALIHEALHTLGLGENPPSTAAITRTVEEYCLR